MRRESIRKKLLQTKKWKEKDQEKNPELNGQIRFRKDMQRRGEEFEEKGSGRVEMVGPIVNPYLRKRIKKEE